MSGLHPEVEGAIPSRATKSKVPRGVTAACWSLTPAVLVRIQARQPACDSDFTRQFANGMLKQPSLKSSDSFVAIWFAVFSAVTFLAFGFDKWRARRSGQRVSELMLVMLGALGGWPGGLLGMIVFRHKTAKWTFKF